MSIIRQWFGSMNEVLDDLIARYPHASSGERERMQEQWEMLKSSSDAMIELWLQLEEKMALFRQFELQDQAILPYIASPEPPDAQYELQQDGGETQDPELVYDRFRQGQGYFKLHMFDRSAEQLEEALRIDPDFTPGRLYLAMTRLHLKQWDEAQHHFQLLSALAEEPQLKAIAYNALGCIRAVYAQFEQARAYFGKALESDPTFGDARHNLDSCKSGAGDLLLQFGSFELQTTGL